MGITPSSDAFVLARWARHHAALVRRRLPSGVADHDRRVAFLIATLMVATAVWAPAGVSAADSRTDTTDGSGANLVSPIEPDPDPDPTLDARRELVERRTETS